ncbi:MAG TPA: hypothetical protein DD670_15265 [Planctomycetaceae bacterium]|nr:hypothetical protein [Planctomycetaceae bacterium]
MTKTMLGPVLAASSLLVFGACISEKRELQDETNSAPIVVTLHKKTSLESDKYPQMSVTQHGSLLSSSFTLESISGNVHGVPAQGLSVYTEGSKDKPVFSVLRGVSATDGKPTVVLGGESSVAWRLIVEDEDGVIVRDGEAVKLANAFPPGSFELQVLYPSKYSIMEGEEKTQGVESEDSRPR